MKRSILEPLEPRIALAFAGDLDLTFGGGDGMVTTDFFAASLIEDVRDAAVQADGKVVVVGSAGDGFSRFSPDIVVARFNANGTPDLAFGSGGRVLLDFGGTGYSREEGFAVVVQSNGKIAVGGRAWVSASLDASSIDYDFALARLNSDGALDTTFGTAGFVRSDFGTKADEIHDLVLDGTSIVAVGRAGDNAALARYDAGGVLDATFGVAGKVTTDFGAADSANGVALDGSGRIVVAGTDGKDFVIARYTSAGVLDTTFDADGLVFTDFNAKSDAARDVAIDASGKIVAGGTMAITSAFQFDFALARYTDTGALDTTFSGDGKATLNIAATTNAQGFESIEGVTLTTTPAGKILVAGTYPSPGNAPLWAAARFNSDGALDATFGASGISRINFPVQTFGEVAGVVLQSDGTAVVVGDSRIANDSRDTNNIGLARLDTGGVLLGTTQFDVKSSARNEPRAAVLMDDGRLVVAGQTTTTPVPSLRGTQITLSRYLPDGSPDPTFGTGGGLIVDFDFFASQPSAVFVEPDGKIVVTGQRFIGVGEAPPIADSLIARFNADGSVDTTFGTNGVIVSDVMLNGFAQDDRIVHAVRQSDGKIVAMTLAQNLPAGFSQTTISRYTNTGTLDPTFGGDGTIDFNTGFAADLAIDASGRLLVGGNSSAGLFLQRFNSDGTIDATFGNGGIATEDLPGFTEAFVGMVLEPDGKISVGAIGAAERDDDTRGFEEIVRFTSNGQLDTSYATGGHGQAFFTGSGFDANAFIRGIDGTYYFGGSTNTGWTIVRLTANGAADIRFGTSGAVFVDFPMGDQSLFTLAQRPTGELVATGVAVGPRFDNDIGVAQLETASPTSPNGVLAFSASGFRGPEVPMAGITVVRTGGTLGQVTVHYATIAGGTASEGGDYTAVSGTLTFDAGETSKVFFVPLVVDNVGEPDETIILQLDTPTGGAVLDRPFTVPLVIAAHNGPNGALDASFGNNGMALSDHTGVRPATSFTDEEQVADMILTPEGKIVAVGFGGRGPGALDSSQSDFLLSRFNADGTPDTTFSLDGSVLTDFRAGHDNAASVTLLADGKLFVVGTSTYDRGDSRVYPEFPGNSFSGGGDALAFARYNDDGTLDRTFGDGGQVLFYPEQVPGVAGIEKNFDLSNAIVLGDGKILVGAVVRAFGSSLVNLDKTTGVFRFNADGTLDTTFGTGGFAIAAGVVFNAFGSSNTGHPHGLAVQADGKILLAGSSNATTFEVLRFNADGTLDAGFGTAGRVTTNVTASTTDGEIPRSVFVQSDGKIVVTGEAGTSGVVVRYNENGTLDTGFDGDGIAAPAGVRRFFDAAQLIGGKLVVAGMNTGGHRIVAQLLTDGTGDPLFGISGIATLGRFRADPNVSSAAPEVNGGAILVDPDNRIVAGYAARLPGETNTQFAVVRLTTDPGPGRLTLSASEVEVDENAGSVSVFVERTSGTGGQITVQYAAVSGTAQSPADFSPVSGTLTFEDGESVKEVIIPIFDDAAPELGETFTFTISNPGGGATLGATTTSTITIADGPGRLAFVSPIFNFAEINARVSIPVSRTGGTSGGVAVNYTITGLTATSGEDFDALGGGTIFFNDRQSSASIDFYLRADQLAERREEIQIVLGDPAGGAVLGLAETTVNIFDSAPGHGSNAGALDPTFAGGVVRDLLPGTGEASWDTAIQADGKIVVVGETGGNASDFVIARYNADGTLDASFGAAGKVTADFFGGADSARAVVIQPNGKIVAAGFAVREGRGDFAIARFNTDGSLDTSFDGDGRASVDFGLDDRAFAVALAPDGGIAVGGWTSSLFGTDFAVARLTSAGALDTAFSGDGRVTQDFRPIDRITSIVVQPDGKIIAAGNASRDAVSARNDANTQFVTVVAGQSDFTFIRYNTNGTLDTSFAGDGLRVGNDDNGATTNATINKVLLRPSGHIVFGGTQLGNFFAGQLDETGRLDRWVTYNLANGDTINDLALQPDGSLIGVGRTRFTGEGADRVAIVRLKPDYGLDEDFGLAGKAALSGFNAAAVACALDENGHIVTVGDGFEVARILGQSAAPAQGVFGFDAFFYTVDESAGTVTITVTRPRDSSLGRVSVDYAAIGGSALPGQDFTSVFGTLIFDETETRKSFTIPIANDALREEQEYFHLLLVNPTGGAEIGSQPFATVFIPKNDQTASLKSGVYGKGVGFDFVFEGSVGANGFGSVTISRTGGSVGAVSVDYSSRDGTARAGVDYVPFFGTLNFANGETSKTISFTTIGDSAIEGDEDFFIDFSAPRGGSALSGAFKSLQVVIPDNVPDVVNDCDNAGTVDAGFDTDGKVVNSVFATGAETIRSLVRMSDGRLVAVGDLTGSSSSGTQVFVTRYTAEGALDATFGTGGSTTLNVKGDASNEELLAAHVLPDGRVLAFGNTRSADGLQLFLTRFTAAGALDTTFGTAGYAAVTYAQNFFGAGSLKAAAFQPDGKVVIAGTHFNALGTEGDLALLRFNADGSLDSTFGTGGALTYDFGLSSEFLGDVKVQADGKILVTQSSTTGPVRTLRFNANGTLDTGFGTNGVASTSIFTALMPAGFTGNDGSAIDTIAQQTDGKILIAGRASVSGRAGGVGEFTTKTGTFVIRYNADGTPDATFGTDGFAINMAKTSFSEIRDIAVQPDGRIVLGGNGSSSRPTIARFLPDGRIDIGVGEGGIATTEKAGISGFANSMVLQPDGRIVTGGSQFSGANQDSMLVRFLGGTWPGDFRVNNANLIVAEDGGSITVEVERVCGLDGAVSVHFATVDGTAIAGTDFTATSGTLSWGDQEAGVKMVTIPITNDAIFQGNLDFTLALDTPTGGAMLNAQSSAAITIIDDENPGKLEFADVQVLANENDASATITVRRVEGKGGPVSVQYAITGGSAVAGSDYTAPVAGTLNFADGETMKSFNVPLLDDTTLGEDQTLVFTLSNPMGGAAVGTNAMSRLTIIDNEVPSGGVFGFAGTQLAVGEGAGNVLITITRTGGSDGEATVVFTAAAGSAINGRDFIAVTDTFFFAAGETTKSFLLPILDDAEVDGDRTIALTLSSPAGEVVLTTDTLPTIGEGAATITVTDDDARGVRSFPGGFEFFATTFAGAESKRFASVLVIRTGGTDGAASVNFTTGGGTATAGQDYTLTSGTLSFADGEVAKTVVIPLTNDADPEGVETVGLTLSNPQGGATLGTRSAGTLNISDDGTGIGQFQFSLANFFVAENRALATITVQRLGSTAGLASVQVDTSDGSAKAGRDYLAVGSLVLDFADGEAAQTFTVPIRRDYLSETNEQVNLTLSAPTGATLGAQSTATLTILDDDPHPLPDIDGDGDFDLVLLRKGKFYVHHNPGDGVFPLINPKVNPADAAKIIATVKSPSSFLFGDFDGDGNDDLAVLSATKKNISILLGNDDGSLDAPVQFVSGPEIISRGKTTTKLPIKKGFVAADFDGDGDLDLAGIGSKGINVLLNTSTPGNPDFAPAAQAIEGKGFATLLAGDFHEDAAGNIDLAAFKGGRKPTVSIFEGDGLGAFDPAPVVSRIPKGMKAIQAADANSDGHLDFVAIFPKNNLGLLLGDGTGDYGLGLLEPGTPVASLLISTDKTRGAPLVMGIGDFDDDLDLDFLAVTKKAIASVIANNNPLFALAAPMTTNKFKPTGIAVADINGDDDPDLVLFNKKDQFRVAFGAADATFGAFP